MVDGAAEVTEPTQPKASPTRKRRGCLSWPRLGCAAVLGLGLAAVAVGGGGYFLLTPSGQSWVKGQVVGLVEGAMAEGGLVVDSLSYGLDGKIALGGVVLRDVDGREIVVVDQVDATLEPWALLGGVVRLTTVDLTGVRGDLLVDEAGQLDVVRLFATEADPDAAPFEGLPVDIRVDAVQLRDGSVQVRGLEEPLAVEHLEVDTAFTAEGLRFGIEGLKVRGRFVDPSKGPLAVDGRFVWQGSGVDETELEVSALRQRLSVSGHARSLGAPEESVDLVVDVTALDLGDIDQLTGAGVTGQFSGNVQAKGTLAELGLAGSLTGVDGTQGRLTVDGTVDTANPAWSGAVTAEDLRIDHLLKGMTDPFPITTSLTVEGAGSNWPDGVAMTGRLSQTSLEILGIQLDSATAILSLDQGVIGLTELDVRGPSGHVTGTASVDLQRSMVVVDAEVDSLNTRHLRSVYVPAELDGTRGGGQVHVEVDYGAPEVMVDVSGTIRAYPLRWTDEIVAKRANGAFDVRVRGTDVDVDCSVRTTDLTSYGYVSDTARSDNIEVRVRSTGVTGKGELTLGPGRYVFVPEGFTDELGQGLELSGGTGTWTMEQGSEQGDPLVVNAGVDVGPHKISRYPGTAGRVDVAMVDEQVDLIVRLDATASRRLVDMQARMDLNDLSFVFDQLQFAPEPGQTWTAQPGAALRVDGLGVADLQMDLRSARGRLGVSGAVGLDGPQDLHVDVYDLDLLAIAELLPMWAEGVEGYVGGIVDIDGTAESPEILANLEVADVAYAVKSGDTTNYWASGLGSRLTVAAAESRVEVSGLVSVDGAPILDLDLDLPFDTAFANAGFRMNAPLDAKVTLVPGGYRRLEEVSGIAIPTEGSVTARLRLGETLAKPSLELDLDGSAEVPTLPKPVRLTAEVRRAPGEALTWGAEVGEQRAGTEPPLVYLTSAGSASTRLDEAVRWGVQGGSEPAFSDPAFWLGDLDAELVVRELPLAPLVGLSGVPLDIDGKLAAMIEVGGTAMRPLIKGRASLKDGRAGSVAFEQTSLALEYDDAGYNIGLNADIVDVARRKEQGGLGTLYMAGHVPLVLRFDRELADWVTGDLALRVDADLPLAMASAYDSGVRQARGLVELDGIIQGSPLDPKPHLDIFVGDDARFAYRPIGVLFSKIEAAISFNERAVTISRLATTTSPSTTTGQLFNVFGGAVDSVEGSLRGQSKGRRREKSVKERAEGRGQILASGEAQLEDWVVNELDLRLTLDRALFLRNGDQYTRLSTGKPLTVTGDVLSPRIAGEVIVDGANLFVDYELLAGGGATSLDSRISVVRPGFSQPEEVETESIFDNVSVDLVVDLGTSATTRVIMPLETAQAFGSAVTAALKIDVEARMQGRVNYRQHPCSVRDDNGDWQEQTNSSGRCGLLDPEVSGTIDISDGSAKIFQSQFDLEESTVSFIGNEVYNPNIDINGSMTAEDLVIAMTIDGTAYQPLIRFDSDDTDQELLAVITGRNPDNLASASASQLLNVVATAALGSALAGVNLPVVSIDATGQVQVGLNLTRRLFVEATLGGTPRPDENVIEVEAEYSVLEGLLIRGGTGAYATPFWLDVLFERGFD